MRGLFCCGDLLNMYMRSSMYGIYEEYWNMETNLRVKRTGTRTEEKNDYNKHRIDSMKQTESRKNAGNWGVLEQVYGVQNNIYENEHIHKTD